jgi:NADH-quinone oxidoreductase subunit H
MLMLRLALVSVGAWLVYAYMLRLERQMVGGLRLRGDARWGLLWPIVDSIRALGKKSSLPGMRPALAWGGAAFALGMECLTLALLPWQRDDGIGFMLLLAVNSSALLGILVSARGAGSPPLWQESQRLVRQALGFTVPALLALAGAFLLARTLALGDLVEQQRLALPYALYQPLGLAVFAVAALLGARRLPLPQSPEADALLVDFHWQHSGGLAALLHMAEYVHLLVIGGIIAVVYLGGGEGPWLPSPMWLGLKTFWVTAALLWLRSRWLNRRAAWFQAHGWGALCGIALLNVIVTIAIVGWGF